MDDASITSTKMRLILKSIDAVHKSIQWAVDHNRYFTIQSAPYVLGWMLDLDVRHDETFEYFEELLNEPKTEPQVQA